MADQSMAQSQIRHLAECSICFLIYNTTERKPKTISCGHTYCDNCLQKLVKSNLSTITCPQDRVVCKIPGGRVNDLPTNFSILNLADITCDECHEKPKKSKCLPEHCKMQLCEDCFDIHHKQIGTALKTSLKVLTDEMNSLQAICDDDEDVQLLEEQCIEVTEAVSLICDEFKQKLVQRIKERSVADKEMLLRWKTNLSLKISHMKSFIRESLSILSTSTKAASVIGDIQNKLMSEKEAISAEKEKPPTTTFHPENLKQEMQAIFPNLLLVFMTRGVGRTATDAAAHTQKAKSTVPDYSSAKYQCQYGTRGSGDRQLRYPGGICLSPTTSQLAVADEHNNRIQALDSKLQFLHTIGKKGDAENQYECPFGITVNSKGNLFITDTKNHRIQIISSCGRYLGQFGTKGSGKAQYHEPMGISCDEDDLLHVCDKLNYRVQVVKEDGEVVRSIGCKGNDPGQLKYTPWNIACSRVHDKVIITDGNYNLHFFRHKGQFMKTIKAAQPPYDINPCSIAIDHVGNVIIGDAKAHHLVIMGPDGDMLCTVGGPGQGPCQFDHPSGIVVTRDGRLYIADSYNHRIQLLNYEFISTKGEARRAEPGALMLSGGCIGFVDPQHEQPWLEKCNFSKPEIRINARDCSNPHARTVEISRVTLYSLLLPVYP